MRKDETLEQEAARKKAEAELPGRISACTDRVSKLCDGVRGAIETMKNTNRPNCGGEKSGTISQEITTQ